jgi:ribulose-bisphosphate carboxylase small chain
MAVSMVSSAPVAARIAAPVPASSLMSSFTPARKVNGGKRSSNAGRIKCMKVWPPIGNIKKFETLSYLPPLTNEQLSKEVDYLIRKGWVPCLEFETEKPFIYREHGNTPGYYDGRYWTMWKLPMFGCTDSSQVLKEVQECIKEYPKAFVRIIGFDNVRQVQCISFIAHKPGGY